MGQIRKLKRSIKRKTLIEERYKGSVEDAIFIHFQGRLFCCENCEDLKVGVCPGRGLKGYEEIKRCMSDKDIKLDSNYGEFNQD